MSVTASTVPILLRRGMLAAVLVVLAGQAAQGAPAGDSAHAATAEQTEAAGAAVPADAAGTAGRRQPSEPSGGLVDRWDVDQLEIDQVRRSATAALVFAAIGLGPVVVLIASGFVRITIVLSLLRQALGTPGIPPNQVLTGVSFLLTLLVMTPVWTEVYDQAAAPLLSSADSPDWKQLWQDGSRPVHAFMSRQIQAAGNAEDIWLFLRYLPEAQQPSTYEAVPMRALLPAFVLSELKTAFLIGFQIYLPFLVIDLMVSATTMAMGMLMLPPQAVAIPLKLLLFVMVDGWHLVAQMLLGSFVPLG